MDYGELDTVFITIAAERGRAYAETLREIIVTNDTGRRTRLAWYLRQHDQHTVEGYVRKVQRYYDAEHDFISSLQVARDEMVWADVQQQARGIAYRYLSRHNFHQHVCTLVSDDIAQDVCIQILSAHYPYDTVFDAWLTKICTNIGYTYVKQRWADEKRQADIELINYVSYENLQQTPHLCVILGVSESELKAAIQQLSLQQQDVIEKHYMQEISLADISKELGVDRNVLYKRHADARKRLRKILGI